MLIPPIVRELLISAYHSFPIKFEFTYEEITWTNLGAIRHESFAAYLLEKDLPVEQTISECRDRGWTLDIYVDVACEGGEQLPRQILAFQLPPGQHRLVGIRETVLTPIKRKRGNHKKRTTTTKVKAIVEKARLNGTPWKDVVELVHQKTGETYKVSSLQDMMKPSKQDRSREK